MNEPQQAQKEHSAFRRQLENMVHQFLGLKFQSAQELWQLQLDLLQLQQEIQVQISSTKKRVRRNEEERINLTQLQDIRWHSRRFGDAIAWSLLGDDRKLIYPLASNTHVSIGESGSHGNRGVISMCPQLWANGWGFPVLHDITDVLRIGDATFISYDADKIRTRTVEIKTSVIGEEVADDGRKETHYAVSVIYRREDAPDQPQPAEPKVDSSDSPQQRKPTARPSSRVDRQFARMDTARARQRMTDGSVTRIEGMPTISLRVAPTPEDHWRVLRRVIRASRNAGYATESVEDTFLYAAFYDKNEISADDIKKSPLLEELKMSGLLFDNSVENSLILNLIADPRGKGPDLFLPYFLYSIPRRAVIDILNRRLTICVIASSGRILQAFEHAGYTVKAPDGRADLRNESLTIRKKDNDERGGEYFLQFRTLQNHLNEIVHEFRSIKNLINITDRAFAGMEQIHKGDLHMPGRHSD